MTAEPERSPPRGLPVAALATVALVAATGALACLGAKPSVVVTCEALAFLPYAAVVRRPGALPLRATLALAALAAIPALAAPTILSDDLYRYLWDGRLLLHGISPYAYAPDDPRLAPLRDAVFARLNHTGLATIYPPVAALLFALASPLGVLGPKLLALLAHLATTPIVARLAGERGREAAAVHALCPLALVETALAGHVDAVAGALLALGVLFLVGGRTIRAAWAAGLATATKLVGLLLLPMLAVRDRRAAALLVGFAFLALAPLVSAGGSTERAGLGHYARRWRGNDGLYGVVEATVAAGLVACCETSPRRVSVPGLDSYERLVRGTPLDPRHTFLGPKKEPTRSSDLHLDSIAPFLARALVAALVVGLALVLARRRVEPLAATRHLVLAALLLAPQVHPWYLLVLLPLEAASGRLAGLVFAAAVLVAYAPLDGWLAHRTWDEPLLGRLLEHGLVLAVVVAEGLGLAAPLSASACRGPAAPSDDRSPGSPRAPVGSEGPG